MLRLLIERGAEIEKAPVGGMYSPLHHAQKVEIVQLILEMGVNINVRNHNGQTPATFAVRMGNAPVLAFLLDHGAGISIEDNSGRTPLKYVNRLVARPCLGCFSKGDFARG
ncbi:ankyrin [Gonapodya prolifera JEL478]|uniref:Ankyrin n=1 Tax=Gonapodya prolifera (strain JEL478) TaxID=1344416 RepID=A0A139ATE9_GONPJ|nr:ankyrin [Gonapodya prolifera JEL478]|eukprot:KXS19843.1 ankyrin [Gonapodya prolifera JEL478]